MLKMFDSTLLPPRRNTAARKKPDGLMTHTEQARRTDARGRLAWLAGSSAVSSAFCKYRTPVLRCWCGFYVDISADLCPMLPARRARKPRTCMPRSCSRSRPSTTPQACDRCAYAHAGHDHALSCSACMLGGRHLCRHPLPPRPSDHTPALCSRSPCAPVREPRTPSPPPCAPSLPLGRIELRYSTAALLPAIALTLPIRNPKP